MALFYTSRKENRGSLNSVYRGRCPLDQQVKRALPQRPDPLLSENNATAMFAQVTTPTRGLTGGTGSVEGA